MKKFYLETFGCKTNQYETEQIREALLRKNYVETSNPHEAQYIYINSCAITANAERDARNAVYRLKNQAPEAKLILTGCAAQFFDNFTPLKHAPYFRPDYIVAQKNKIKSVLASEEETPGNLSPSEKYNQITSFKRGRPVIKIQDGCSQHCSYCIVPQIRGKSVSRSRKDIRGECFALLEAGFAELVISGINVAEYETREAGYSDFWDLIQYLVGELRKEFAGCFRLRLSSLDPALLNDKGMRVLLENSEICPHLHLSLQHASKKVLREMRRSHYDPMIILNRLAELRSQSLFAVGADILIGFPGETEEDLKILQEFCKNAQLSYAHIFPYSPRPRTQAATRMDQISFHAKKERAVRIKEIVKESRRNFLLRQMTLPGCVMISEMNNRNEGINEYYVSCKIEQPFQGLEKMIQVKPVAIKNETLVVDLLKK